MIYGVTRSSLSHLYVVSTTTMPTFFKQSQLIDGMKHIVEKEIQEIGIKVGEGKLSMSFKVYSLLCDFFCSAQD